MAGLSNSNTWRMGRAKRNPSGCTASEERQSPTNRPQSFSLDEYANTGARRFGDGKTMRL